jgi:manganese oxidase
MNRACAPGTLDVLQIHEGTHMYGTKRAVAATAAALLMHIGIVARPAGAEDLGIKRTAVVPNDNRDPAGVPVYGTLVLKLRAGFGLWRPEGDGGPALPIEAFGEEDGPLSAPAPLIRVTEGTRISVSVKNDLDVVLRVHGLCARDDAACAPIDVPPAATRQVAFTIERAGTYHYWGTTTGMPLRFRGAADTQLSGALIVDPRGAPVSADRVLVITDWTSLTRQQLSTLAAADDPGVEFFRINPRFMFLVNGLSWPATERLTYTLGDEVKWRVINLSSQPHPMHLHGFHFEVASVGDGLRDTTFGNGHRQRVVTQLLPPGGTFGMIWEPQRVGNWVFHCHILAHVSPAQGMSEPGDHGAHHPGAAMAGMAGLVLGVTIVDPDGAAIDYRESAAIPTRRLTLFMQTEKREGATPAYGFALAEKSQAPPEKISVPGPTLVLRRGEPVEITLVNRLPEATSIHWHGMELDSFYDGVHGWGGIGSQRTPLIEPGGSFVVRFTPPRSGTLIYHTHMHDTRQLTSGLYGAMLVMEPGETHDAAVDHVVVIGRDGPGMDAPTVINGSHAPQMVWKAGTRHRVRFVHITPDDIFVVSLRTAEKPIEWRPIMKDGAAIPSDQRAPKPAVQTIAVGETYDFELDAPPGRQTLWMEVRSPAGKWHAQGHVIIK